MTFIAFFIRELTFSSFFEYLGQQIIIFSFLAFYLNFHSKNKSIFILLSKRRLLLLFPFILAVYVITICKSISNEKNDKLIKNFIFKLENNQFDSARYYLNKTPLTLSGLIYRSSLNWNDYKHNGNIEYLSESKKYLLKSIDINPRDVLLYYNLSIILEEENKIDSTKNLMKNIINKYPKNALYRRRLAQLEYNSGNKEIAMDHFTKAIMQAPNILKTPSWGTLIEEDSIFANQVYNKINLSIDTENNNPIIFAKYGRLYMLLKNEKEAEVYLKRAVEILPNLAKPWYYLASLANNDGNTKKRDDYYRRFIFLNTNKPLSHEYDITIFEETIDDYNIFYTKYFLKFHDWYKSIPSKFIFYAN